MKEELPEHELLVFTGPIDAYFASQVSVFYLYFLGPLMLHFFNGPIDAYFASQVSVRHTIFIK